MSSLIEKIAMFGIGGGFLYMMVDGTLKGHGESIAALIFLVGGWSFYFFYERPKQLREYDALQERRRVEALEKTLRDAKDKY